MAITKFEALTENMFHQTVSGRTCRQWRRNGQTKIWKTRPNDFRVPVKFGLYGYDVITQDESADVHTASSCPNNDVRTK